MSSGDRRRIATVNPSTGEQLDTYPVWSNTEIDLAVGNAYAAGRAWAGTDITDRSRFLEQIASQLRGRKHGLASLVSQEMGKPLSEALAEVDKCAWVCEYYAEAGPRQLADVEVAAGGRKSWISHEPLGVILGIMPWNFPLWQVLRFIAPTLLAGNTVLLKHSPNVTGCALAIEDVLTTAGLPDGVFRALVLAEDDVPKATSRILEDDRVAGVSLTGSESAGSSVAATAGRVIKPSLLELGGSDPFVVLDDADLSRAVAGAVKSRFLNAGQSCLAAKRFIVHESIAERFTTDLVRNVKKLKVGDPSDAETQVGPLAREDLVSALEDQVSAALDEGATLHCGGERLERAGFFYAPTVLTGVTEKSRVMTEETFGPVAVVATFDDDDVAARMANNTRYGLGASVWSKDVSRAMRLGKTIASGAIFVNAVVASDPRLPFGGTKRSGYGRELGVVGVREFVNVRTWLVEA